jgi:hypothetical protein
MRAFVTWTGIAALTLALSGAPWPVANAATVDIPAARDATLFDGAGLTDHSSSGPGLFVGADGQDRAKRGLIAFDIPSFVPLGSTITGASLQLVLGQIAGNDAIPRTIRLFDTTSNWAGSTNGTTGIPGPGFGGTGQGFPANIGDATWNHSAFNTVAWNTPGGGGDFVSTASAAAVIGTALNTAFTWGSTQQMVADVQGWLDGTLTNDGWLLRSDDEGTATTFRAFYTRENALEQGVPLFAPELIVTFTPVATTILEPSGMTVLAVGVLGVPVWRRWARA